MTTVAKPSSVFDEIKRLVHDCALDLIFELKTWTEKCNYRVKANFDTACWIFNKPVHEICIGDKLFDDPNGDRFCIPNYDKKKYVKNHIVHEQGHGEVTIRDRKKLNAALAAISAPFSLFNLFEDARMEEYMRKKHKYAFEWLSMEVLGISRPSNLKKERPEALLFSLIQAEGNSSLVKSKCVTDYDIDNVDKVTDYFERIIAAEDSLALIPILADWLEEFPLSDQERTDMNNQMTDLQKAMELLADPDKLKEFLSGAKLVAGDSEDENGQSVSLEADADENYSSEIASNGNLLRNEVSSAINWSRVKALVAKFERFYQPKVFKVGTTDPQKRFSARRALLNRPPYLKKKVEGPKTKKIVMLIDVSGSMSCTFHSEVNGTVSHISEGVLIASALSQLARNRLVTGHIILSGVINNTPTWQTFKLPMSNAELAKISAYAGAEGLEFSMKNNLGLLMEADEVLVYTDGQICDKPVNKPFFNSRGVFSWGLYAGNQGDTYMPKLLTYFDKGCIKHSAEELVDFILAQSS